MNIVKIIISFKKRKQYETQIEFAESSLTISDSLIKPLLENTRNNEICSCHIMLGANNLAVSVENYTLTDTIFIDGFYDISSYISILQVKDVNVHITKQKVDIFQADCQRMLLADCQINQLDIGLLEHSKLLRIKNETNDELMSTAYLMEEVDIRNCKIRTVKTYIECDYFNVQESIIDVFNLYGGFGSKVVSDIRKLYIWKYTTINSFEIYCQITNFELKESSISILVAKGSCKLITTDTVNSTIFNAYGFEKKNFGIFNIQSWLLIGKSAENNLNISEKNEAYFQAAKLKHRQGRGIKKISGLLFGLCSGYGYKPFRAIICCVIMILVASIVCTVANVAEWGWSAFSNYGNNLISSLAAIVGQSDFRIEDGLLFWVATVEYIGAVVLFAIFVNALYVRYKD